MECIVEWMSHFTSTKYLLGGQGTSPKHICPRTAVISASTASTTSLELWATLPGFSQGYSNTSLQHQASKDNHFIIFLCISVDFILTSSKFQHLHYTSGLSLSTGVSNTCLVIDGWQPLTADDSRCVHTYFRTSFASSHASAVCCLKVFVQRIETIFLKRFAEDIDLAACSSSCNVSMEADLVDLTERRGDWSDYHKERTRFKSI